MAGKMSIIRRASLFLKNIKSSSKVVETKEAGTVAIVETDNIHINTEIYSDTDLPGSFECYDGNCMILYASRSKNVTTDCEGSNEKVVPAEPSLPVSEDEKKEEPVAEVPVEPPSTEIQETQKDSWDEGSRHLTEVKKYHVEMKRPMCHPDCPNLFVSRCSQIDKVEKVRVSTAKGVTISITRAEKESVSTSSADVTTAKSCQRPASVPSINLSPIQEEEDPSTRTSEPSIPTRVSCDTMQSAEYVASTASCVTRQEDDWSVQEEDEQNGFSTDEEYTTEVVTVEDENALMTDEGNAVALEDVDKRDVEEAGNQTEATDRMISEAVTDHETDEEATDQPITDDAADQSVTEDGNSVADGAVFKSEQKVKTSEKGIETETIFEREPREKRRSRRAKTSTWITSPSPTRYEETEIRNCIRSSRSPCRKLKYRELCEAQCSSYTSSCVTSANRFCDDDSRVEQIYPTAYCSSKSSSTFCWPQVPVSCDQLYRINNAKNHSVTACNRYHGSINKVCREPSEYWCPPSQSYQNTCAPRCSPRSSMNYCNPSYYYSYNSWY
ncbi:uncharacterized protein LOC144478518 [Augochlora pura]